MKKTSHSAITTYLDCQKKWDLIYNHGLEQKSIHFEFGSMAHKVMETRVIPDELLYPELKEYFKINSWHNYFSNVLGCIDSFMSGMGYRLVGKEVPVEDDNLRGVIDAVWYNDERGKTLITDYKFSTGSKGYNELMVDEQMYIYALLYHKATGVALTEIETGYINIPKQELNEPRVLKNGTLSKDKAQYTTVEKYLNKIKDLGLNVDDYADILEELANKPYVQISIEPLDLTRLEKVFGNIDNVIKDMSKGYVLEKNSYMCTKCDFYDYCHCGKHIP